MAIFLGLILLSFNLILTNNILADNHTALDSTKSSAELDDSVDELELPESHSAKASVPVVTAAGTSATAKAPNDYAPAARTITPPNKILLDSAKPSSPDLLPEIVDTKAAVVTVDPATQKPVIIDQAIESDFVPEVNTNQEGGNWVQKRMWWEQAEAAFAQLTADNNQILQIQADYFKQRTIVDKQLNTVLCDLNISRADLVNFIDKLLEFTSAVPNIVTTAPDKTNTTVSQSGQAKATGDHKSSAAINSSNSGNNTNARLKKLAASQQVGLENIKTYLINLKLIDDALDQVLAELNKQIELCQDYEKQAWDDFKEIGRILNDKKAKALFYQVDGFQKNIQKILEYVTGPLKKFFDDQVIKTKKSCDDLNQEIKQLAAGGLDLRLELDIIAGRTPEPVDLQAEKLAAAKKVKANQSWYSAVSDPMVEFFSGIWGWITGLFK